ncbi:hypothetical protein A2U01_0075176, partial [Trifolium medium]|nr:hypothetical protein [Trifolium medium]
HQGQERGSKGHAICSEKAVCSVIIPDKSAAVPEVSEAEKHATAAEVSHVPVADADTVIMV